MCLCRREKFQTELLFVAQLVGFACFDFQSGSEGAMSHSSTNSYPTWPENIKAELIESIGAYMRQEDSDYDVDAFAVRILHFVLRLAKSES